jgi:hypothetical protein
LHRFDFPAVCGQTWELELAQARDMRVRVLRECCPSACSPLSSNRPRVRLFFEPAPPRVKFRYFAAKFSFESRPQLLDVGQQATGGRIVVSNSRGGTLAGGDQRLKPATVIRLHRIVMSLLVLRYS